MRPKFIFFLKYALLWLAFFIVTKGVFLIYHSEQTALLTFTEIVKVFLYGSRMDFSATGYLLLIPGLFLALGTLLPQKWYKSFLYFYTLLFGIFLSGITAIDFELFKHWGFRFDITPLRYIGKDTLSSTTITTDMLLLFAFAVLLTGILIFYHKLILPSLEKFEPGKWWHMFFYLALTGALFFPIRGSLDVVQMNVGTVFFHNKNPFPNQAAINLFWNFGDSVEKYLNGDQYPENLLKTSRANELFKSLYPTDSSVVKVIDGHPNVLVIILESFTSKIIEPLGGEKGVTPNFNALCKNGILFDNFYSSGDRTDKGLLSILSGYPAQTKTSIVTQAKRTEQLPKLPHYFINMGYSTSFIYGGNANFANLNSYLRMCNFDRIITKDDFPAEAATTKWGVHDGIVFDTLYNHLNRLKPPFFTTLLTLSSHEPFDVPYKSKFYSSVDADEYRNAAYYTDMQLGKFIDRFRQTELWENTLIIFVADHGERHPGWSDKHVPIRFKIPMLWTGGALNVSDTVITKYASQTDIATTLLKQFDQQNTSTFRFGKDIFSLGSKSFSFYDFNNGFGYLDDSTTLVYDLDGKQFMEAKGDSNKLEIGKAYLQTIYNDFNGK